MFSACKSYTKSSKLYLRFSNELLLYVLMYSLIKELFVGINDSSK